MSTETGAQNKQDNLQDLDYLIAARDEELMHVRTDLSAASAHIAVLQREMAERDGRLAELSATVEQRDRQTATMQASLGWQLATILQAIRRAPENAVRAAGRRLIPERRRNRLARRYPSLRRKRPQDESNGVLPAPAVAPPPAASSSTASFDSPLNRPNNRYDVICLAVIEWQFRFQRPQQLALQFAEHGHRVFYINPIKLLLSSAGRNCTSFPLTSNVWDVRLASPRRPMIYREVLDAATVSDMAAGLDALRRDMGIEDAVCLVEFPSWTPLALELRQRFGWRVVYDCMDEWQNFEGVQKPALLREEELARQADILLVTSRRLLEKWQSYNERTLLVRNGVNPEFFARGCRPNDILKDMPHPIIGYFGAIASWFDIEMVHDMATSRPQWHFVLLGGVFDVDVSSLQNLPNVHLLGNQSHELMPSYLYHFDVCIVPFRITPATQAMDLVKLYEYLSVGKPVVSVPLHELEPYKDHIYLASSVSEFIAQIEAALKESDPALMRRRRLLAQANSWRDRYGKIDDAIRGLFAKASLVIVTYNNAPLTQQCLESIYRNTTYPAFEVVVVDNASEDSTRVYLTYAATAYPNLHVILNAENEGFARACNMGVAAASGERIVYLNNDVVAPRGWLGRLMHHLDDPAIGLVGPVSNAACNEANIQTTYSDMKQMEAFAADYTEKHAGQTFDIKMLALYCTAVRRAVLDQIGPLDEQFQVGLFEDDDFAQRVKAAGYRVVCAEDVFIHHVGMAAFGKLSEAEYKRIWDANQVRFEAKWQTKWQRHVGRGANGSDTTIGQG